MIFFSSVLVSDCKIHLVIHGSVLVSSMSPTPPARAFLVCLEITILLSVVFLEMFFLIVALLTVLPFKFSSGFLYIHSSLVLVTLFTSNIKAVY